MSILDEHYSFSMIVSFIAFLFVGFGLLKRLKLTGSSSHKLPPGPWKLPFIGNLHQLMSSLPHHRLRDLAAKYGPLMHLQLGEVSTVVVSSPEMAKEVLKTHDVIFSSRPQVIATKILSYDCINLGSAPYGDYWRQLRRICTLELLSSKRVQSFRALREEEASNMIADVSSSAGNLVNFTQIANLVTHRVVSVAAVGKVYDQEEFLSVLHEFAKALSGFAVADVFPSIKWLHWVSGMKPKLEKLFRTSDAILERIVNNHKCDKSKTDDDDLVDILLKYHEDVVVDHQFALSNNAIKAVILDMIVGGSETTSNIIIWAMSHMMKNPRIMRKAQEEIRQVFGAKGKVDEDNLQDLKYLKLVLKETLRLHPPLPLLIPRVCRERCEINGYEIPVGTRIIINAWAISRDPRYWNDAESFYPERFLDCETNYIGGHFEFLPFGGGRRVCPGISFGMVDIELQFANLLFYFDWKLPDGMKPEDLDMNESFGASVPREKDLYLIPTPYKNK